LFEHKKIQTTEAKAKELRPYAEQLITKAKRALQNEKQGLLQEGQTVDVHNRREVGRFIRSKGVLQELFDTIAPMVESRQGGYTRIIKIGTRRGDGGKAAIIELVDWSAPQDGAVSLKGRKKAVARKPKAPKVAEPAKEEAKPVVETAPVAEVAEVIETPVEEVIETPVAETPVENNEETTSEEVKE
jgi:large subunit ribosomal protein L17